MSNISFEYRLESALVRSVSWKCIQNISLCWIPECNLTHSILVFVIRKLNLRKLFEWNCWRSLVVIHEKRKKWTTTTTTKYFVFVSSSFVLIFFLTKISIKNSTMTFLHRISMWFADYIIAYLTTYHHANDASEKQQ